MAAAAALVLTSRDGSSRTVPGLELPEQAVQHIVQRDGQILWISVTVPEEAFRI